MFVKQAAERTQALEANLEADVGDCQRARRQQLLGLLDSAVREVLMRGLVERRAKEPQEMKARQTRRSGNLLEIQRQVIRVIDELARPHQPHIGIRLQQTRL